MTAEFVAAAPRALRQKLEAAFDRVSSRRRVQLISLKTPARARLEAVLTVLLAISFYYAFLASAGRLVDLPSAQSNYYDRLAEGFRAGHLYLVDPPSPVLLAQENPYAHTNQPHWVWDASLYKKHYYLYFGPVPALMLLGLKQFVGNEVVITDQWPTVVFLVGRLLAGAGLVLGLANRLKLPPPAWLCALAVAVFGLAHPVPYVSARTHVWETALAGGQCFLFVGLWLAFVALHARRFRRVALFGAGTAWALAIGCRATMAIPTPLLVLCTLGMLWYLGHRRWTWALDVLALCVPFATLCLLHGWYNWARFDSPFEFGIRYQTTTQPFRGGPAYILPNAFAYLFTPPHVTCRFPFVILPANRVLPTFLGPPLGYATFEQLGGLLFLAPWIVIAPLGAWRAFRRRKLESAPAHPAFSPSEIWLALCCLANVPAMIPVLHLWLAAPRYPGDMIGGLVLLSSIFAFAWWRNDKASSAGKRRLTSWAWVPTLGILTCVFGALTAFAISTRTFAILNPIVYQRLEAALSLCPAPPGQEGRI